MPQSHKDTKKKQMFILAFLGAFVAKIAFYKAVRIDEI